MSLWVWCFFITTLSNSSCPNDIIGSLIDDELLQVQTDEETDGEVSIGTEIPDHEQLGDNQSHELIPQDNDDDNNHGN